jgi:hypothetical protein
VSTFANPQLDYPRVEVSTNGVALAYYYPRCLRCGWAGEKSRFERTAKDDGKLHEKAKCIEPAGEGANANPVV